MSGSPRVSIIIPVHNYAHFLKRTLDSVMDQVYRDYEVIVVDDGSEDDPLAVVELFGSRIRFLRQDNQGVCAARNAGLRIAAGEYILFLDADDFIMPDKLHAQVALMEASPAYGIVHSGWWLVDQDAAIYACVTPWDYAPRLDLETWLLWKPVFPGAMLLRKSIINAVGGFDPAFTQAEDVDLVFRMMLTGCEAVWLKRPTVYYRQHPNNTVKNSLGQVENTVRLLEKFFSQGNLPRTIQKLEPRIWYSSLLWNCAALFEAGHISEVQAYLRLAANKNEKDSLDLIGDFYQQLHKSGSQLLESQRLSDLLYELLSNDIDQTPWANLEIRPRDFTQAFGELMRIYNASAEAADYDPDFKGILQLSSRQIVKLLSMQIVGNPNLISPKELDKLWQEIRAAGLVPDQDRFEIITLFLTLFTKSVFSRYWSYAARYLINALVKSVHPRALIPWYRFFRSAAEYAIGLIMGKN